MAVFGKAPYIKRVEDDRLLTGAIIDALRPLGVRAIQMPATPQRVWRAIQDARP